MKATLISDLHGNLIDLSAYESDLLIIAGDICPTCDHSVGFQVAWLSDNFNWWISRQTEYFTKIVFCGGNHDFAFQEARHRIKINDAIYLQDEYCYVNDYKIFGFPWQLWYHDWAFNATEAQLEQIYSKCDSADIIVSHGPPKGYGDEAPRGANNFERTGSFALLNLIDRVKPKLCTYGHIHPGYGIYERNGSKLVNASILNDKYQVANAPIVVEI